jgi:cardiolipin synthase
MNVPNLLSLLRLVITVFFVVAVMRNQFGLALTLFVVQGLSDLLDGFLARVMKAKTRLGAFLDPLADKTMLVSSYLVLSFKGMVPLWVTGCIIARDVIILVGFLRLRKTSGYEEFLPSMWGKVTTTFQIVTVVWVLWSRERAYDALVFYPTLCLTVISGVQYIRRGFRINRKG